MAVHGTMGADNLLHSWVSGALVLSLLKNKLKATVKLCVMFVTPEDY